MTSYFFSVRGVCNPIIPVIKSIVNSNGYTYYYYRFYTYTLSAFN